MFKNAARMLEGLHAGHIVIRDHNGSLEGDEDAWVFGWEVEIWGEALHDRALSPTSVPKSHPRRFDWMRADDLLMDDLIERSPNGPSRGRYVLTEKGLAAAQERFGPIVDPVPVLLEDAARESDPDGLGPAARVVLVNPSPGVAATVEGAETIVIENTAEAPPSAA